MQIVHTVKTTLTEYDIQKIIAEYLSNREALPFTIPIYCINFQYEEDEFTKKKRCIAVVDCIMEGEKL